MLLGGPSGVLGTSRTECPILKISKKAFLGTLILGVNAGCARAEVMAIERGLVIRPIHAKDRQVFEALPRSVVVLQHPPLEPATAAFAFSASYARGDFVFAAKNGLYIMSSGPVLDGPDTVEIRRLDRRGNQFHLQIAHTQVRLQDRPLLRNVPWRPMVAVPLPGDLPSGAYGLQVTWQAVERIPGGLPLAGPEAVETLRFEITGQ